MSAIEDRWRDATKTAGEQFAAWKRSQGEDPQPAESLLEQVMSDEPTELTLMMLTELMAERKAVAVMALGLAYASLMRTWRMDADAVLDMLREGAARAEQMRAQNGG